MDEPNTPTIPPTFDALIALAEALFEAGPVATTAQAEKLQAAIDKLLRPGRGSGADPNDPADKAQMAAVLYQQQQQTRRRRRRYEGG